MSVQFFSYEYTLKRNKSLNIITINNSLLLVSLRCGKNGKENNKSETKMEGNINKQVYMTFKS